MSVLKKLKSFLESHDDFDANESYADMLRVLMIDIPGYPKMEIEGEGEFITSEEYNSEKYELLDTEIFEVVSVDDEEVVVCAAGSSQTPLTFSIKLNKKGRVHITNVYHDFSEGLTKDEFNDLVENN